MEFMLWFTVREDAPEPEGMAERKGLAEEVARRGRLRRGAALGPASAGARVRVRDGKAFVSDGPIAERQEVVEGFWIVEAASRAEAIEIAREGLLARPGAVEVHRVADRYAFRDSEDGTPFLLGFRIEPGLSDPDGAKLREMVAFAEDLARQGRLSETAPLASDPPPARIETRGGVVLVTDGPFAEAKEAVGGYSLVRAADRAEAIELAVRYPHARWGPVEVREIRYLDPV